MSPCRSYPAGIFAGALAGLPGLGPVAVRRAVERLGGVREAWEAPVGRWEEALEGRLSAQAAASLREGRREEALERLARSLEACGATVVTPWEPGGGLYPLNLRHLPDLPPALYVRGTLRLEDRFAVAIVGSRQASPAGRMAAAAMAFELACRGYTIVSGLARGIDAAAHAGAIRAGGRTIGVVACGIDDVYPRGHRELARQVTRHGALVSEYPPGTPVDRWRFAARNRIIAGLGLVVLVAEARRQSGAVATAEMAADLSREGMAMPGFPMEPSTAGSNALLRDGALICTDVLDVELAARSVLEQLERNEAMGAAAGPLPAQMPVMPPLRLDPPRAQPGRARQAPEPPAADETAPVVLQALEGGPLETEVLAARTGLAVPRLLAVLTRLEAAGQARRLLDGRWAGPAGEIK